MKVEALHWNGVEEKVKYRGTVYPAILSRNDRIEILSLIVDKTQAQVQAQAQMQMQFMFNGPTFTYLQERSVVPRYPGSFL